ncbi:MAG: tetratricopeptide repeat protein [Planctomycetota bacterium]
MSNRTVHGLLSFAAALCVAATAPAQDPEPHGRPERGDLLPEFSVLDAASGERVQISAALAAPGAAGPLVLAFVHRDKELCTRFLGELGEQLEALGEDRERCAIMLVFSGEETDGKAIAAARALPAPCRVYRDPDRKAYEAMGLIAFPTVYVVDRGSRTIELLRRGYTLTLAREAVGRLRIGLGRITAEELARAENPALEPSPEIKRHATRVQQARLLLRSGKPEQALEQFEVMLGEDPHDPAALAGRAIAAGRLGRADALALLQAAHGELPDDSALALALGEALLAADRPDDAEPLLRSALEREGAPAWFALGRLHERGGRWKEAALAYREAASRLLR